ncbi:hypothetical protein cypCar_00043988, partial [Cyprinus carpio]
LFSIKMPVDRMRMRPWLEQQIESGQIQGLHWVNEEKKIFQIPWMHAARHGWDLEKDAPLFMNWAIHTGKYRPGIDKPDPKTWKANFRCAMNSLPDIEEVKDKSIKRGSNAFRMYRMLSSYEKAVKKGKKKIDLEQRAKRVFQKRKAGIPRKYKRTKEQIEENLMEETTPDSTVLFTESDTESTYSEEEDLIQLPQDLSLKASQRSACNSVLRIPSSAQSSPNTFFTSTKINFKVTSSREDSPLFAYNTPPWFPCLFNFQKVTDEEPSSTSPSPDLTSCPTSQASVIPKAVDLSVAKHYSEDT